MTITKQARDLQQAIRCGHVDKAEKLARALAQSKAQIVVQVEGEDVSEVAMDLVQGVRNNTINLKIYLNSSFTNNATVYLDADPTITFAALKQLIGEKFRIPVECQQLNVNNVAPRDDDILEHYGLMYDDSELSVYEREPVLPSTVGVMVDDDDEQPGPSNSSQLMSVVPDLIQQMSPNVANMSAIVANVQPVSPREPVWSCDSCTYENHPSLLVCEMCDTPRRLQAIEAEHFRPVPDEVDDVRLDDEVDADNAPIDLTDAPDEDDDNIEAGPSNRRVEAYNDLMAAEFAPLIENTKSFDCPICFTTIEPGTGVVIRECLHTFCRTCLGSHIGFSENAVVTCPFNDGSYKCQSSLQDREIRALVTDDVYEQHLRLSAREAEGQAQQSYHCKTPDCTGWCTYEDDVTTFFCYACRRLNCLSCDTIHEGEECRDYQRKLRAEMKKNPAAFADASLDQLLKFGDAMKCPQCATIIIKMEGCDWVQCTVCKMEICWVTQQPRWGPKGRGDTSGGCRCRVNGKLCHPQCQNCH